MSAFFVTGTGTDIGKTFVTAGLIRHLRAAGSDVAALKPVVSGFSMECAGQSDPGVLLAALGEPVNDKTLARISPWRFAAPLSPDMAATRENRTLDYSELLSACRDRATAAGQAILFIEGVGGVMVPLDATHTVRELMADLEIPVILVAGAYLGTISHTLTALAALATRDIVPKAVVINDTGDRPVPLAETAEAIARQVPGLSVLTVPHHAADEDFAHLAELLLR